MLIFISTVGALRRGFIRMIFSLAGWCAGLLIASWNYLPVSLWLSQWIGSIALSRMLAFLLLLAAVMAAASVIASLSRKSASIAGLGFFDRFAGALFGFIRGVLLATVAVMALVTFTPGAEILRHSQLANYFLDASHTISFVVPRYLQEQLAAGASHLLQQSRKPLASGP